MEKYKVSNFNDTTNKTSVTFIRTFNGSYEYDMYPPFESELSRSVNEIYKWAILFVITFGVFGNILCLYVFLKSKLRKVSTSRYCAAIAIVDMGYLLSSLCTILTRWEISIYHIHGVCPLVMYINHICTFLSIWYVTALVIEKFIGLYWPSKKAEFCTVFRAKCVIISFVILAVVCYHYITWTVGSEYPLYCHPWPESELSETYSKLGKIDAFVVSVIPYLLIFCLSCLIAIKTWQFYRRNKSTGFRLHRRQTAFIPQDKEYKTSGLILLIALSTFSLGITNSVIRVFMIMQPSVLITIARFVQTNSYSVKPFLYVIGSRPYRKKLWKLIKNVFICKRWLANPALSELQTVNQHNDNGRAIEIIIEKSM